VTNKSQTSLELALLVVKIISKANTETNVMHETSHILPWKFLYLFDLKIACQKEGLLLNSHKKGMLGFRETQV